MLMAWKLSLSIAVTLKKVLLCVRQLCFDGPRMSEVLDFQLAKYWDLSIKKSWIQIILALEPKVLKL